MTDYTLELFHEDYDKVIPVMLKYRDMESLSKSDPEVKPENAVLEIFSYFIAKYGNSRGTDYEMRFFSVMQFVEHYQGDLFKLGLISESENQVISVPNAILKTLLDSIKPPQPPSPYPSSFLYNKQHEFNYKKVVKVLKEKAQ